MKRTITAVVIVIGGLVFGAMRLTASNPSTDTISVPPVGQTSKVEWTGTIPAGANATSDCTSSLDDTLNDHHGITVQVPSSGYGGLKTTFTFTIDWTPSSGNPTTSDEILTVVSKNGDEADQSQTREIGSSDGSTTTEQVTSTNLPPGSYDVLACGFANALPQSYHGMLTVSSEALPAQASLPSADAQGLAFSAAVPADPQRNESEPLIVSDKAGLLYTCGPTGFSNASDYAQVSTDGGDQCRGDVFRIAWGHGPGRGGVLLRGSVVIR